MILRVCSKCKKPRWAKSDNVRPRTAGSYYEARTTVCKPCRRKYDIPPLDLRPSYRPKRVKRKRVAPPSKKQQKNKKDKRH